MNDKLMKVSFIIPIYKVEKYLNECVNSILSQSYKNIEIILVDDGSPDNCPVMCDEWAEKDKRVKVIHKQNGGLSDARNVGIDNAKGEYIIFVDGDDFWISFNGLEYLLEQALKYPDCDFIGYNCCYYYSNTKTYKKWVRYADCLSEPIDTNTAIISLVSSGTVPMSACLKLISRKLFMKNNLRFIEGTISEDIPWFINLMEVSKKCMFINEYIYAYRQNVLGSITASATEKTFNDLFNIIRCEIQKMHTRSFSVKAKESLYSFLAYEFCILLTMMQQMPKNKQKDLLEYKWLLKYTSNPKVRKVALMNKLLGIKIARLGLRFYIKYIR